MTDVPTSKTRRRHSWLSPIWLVPLLAAGAIGYVIYREVSKSGPSIEIVFRHAEGLDAGKTDLRYRGVKMGEVSDLKLAQDMSHVIATVDLKESASGLARDGAKFWIVRPHVSAAEVKGLSTIVSGPYIGAYPGTGEKKDHFEGLEQAPAIKEDELGLEIYVESPNGSFKPGAPVLYHSIKVGAVADSKLSDDARNVQTRLVIEHPYGDLVRDNSRFWNAGGVKAHFGLLSGLELNAQSFTTLVEGGVAFATPDSPGAKAKDDKSFPLADKEDDAWKSWRPAIHLGHQIPESKR